MRKQTKIAVVASAAALLALGASMTSFAAGWTEEDGTWVYLDKDGDRVYDTWKKSGNNYYYLNEDGEMATSTLIEYEDNYYYVDENGVKVSNQWVALENEDGEQVGNYEPDVLWYYFQSSGKAYTNSNDKVRTIGGKKYIFDDEGRAISGWYESGSKLYYLGTEDECWAYTGWQYIEPDDTLPMFSGLDETDAYDAEKWFNFKSNGQARKDAKAYISGQYYTFDEYGIMQTKWVSGTPGASASENNARYDASNGNLQKGWAYVNKVEDSDSNAWFYLDSYGEAFNEDGKDAGTGAAEAYEWDGTAWDTDVLTGVAAKVIKSKTYLFNNKGQMLTGVYKLAEVAREGSSTGLEGIYFFNDGDGSVEGEMVTGKETVVYDDVECAYYFDKKGKAYVNTIADGVLYDVNGVKVAAEDGNNYGLVNITDDIVLKGNATPVLTNGDTAMVTSSGKIKKSGTVKLDGYKYTIEDYAVTGYEAID